MSGQPLRTSAAPIGDPVSRPGGDLSISSSLEGTLPDAPGNLSAETPGLVAAGSAGDLFPKRVIPPVASKYNKLIEPSQRAPVLTGGDKALIGLRGLRSPFSAIGWVVSASYEQGIGGTPNYPQTFTGYFQRLGAISARNASSGVFGDAVLAPILHQDVRYYRLGPGRSFLYRFRYAATRQLIGRTDAGRPTFNAAEIGGNLASALLTNAYFPRDNRGVAETAKTFGGLVGGGALGYTLVEFFADTLGRIF